ncbi:MAG: HAD-IIB family hydrolase [Firmicutes bacterium]|nr:HAD-IIB family hydrolase [Bacillota bacterium]
MAGESPSKKPKYILATDLDGTLVGSRSALSEFNRLMLKHKNDILLVYITGRTLISAWQLIVQENLLYPHVLITDVGTEIYTPPWFRPDLVWESLMASNWDEKEIRSVIERIEGLQKQEVHARFRLAYYTDRTTFKETVARLFESVRQTKLPVTIVPSMGYIIDAIPSCAGKGAALQYVQKLYCIKREHTLVCGDSGNDLSMFLKGYKGIVVGNAQPELKESIKNIPDEIYLSRSHYAEGILEGLKSYGVI